MSAPDFIHKFLDRLPVSAEITIVSLVFRVLKSSMSQCSKEVMQNVTFKEKSSEGVTLSKNLPSFKCYGICSEMKVGGGERQPFCIITNKILQWSLKVQIRL